MNKHIHRSSFDWKSGITIVFLIALIVGIGFGIHAYHDSIMETVPKVLSFSILTIILLLLLSILYQVTNALQFYLYPLVFNVRLRTGEFLCLGGMSMFFNLAPGRAGLLIRAYYLKKYHGISFTDFTALTLTNYFIAFSVLNIFIFAVSFYLYQTQHIVFLSIVMIISTIMFFGMIISLLIRFKEPKKIWFLQKLYRAHEGWKLIKNKPIIIISGISLSLLNYFIYGMILYVISTAMGYSVGLLPSMVTGMITSYGILISFLPGNIGVQETIITAVYSLFGIDPVVAAVISVVFRVISLLITVIIGPITTAILLRSRHFTIKEALQFNTDK